MNPIIDTSAFSRSAGRIEGAVSLAGMERLATSLREPGGEILLECEGRPDGRGRPALRMQLSGRLELRCDRCGGPLLHDVDVDREFYFVRDMAELQAIPVDPLEVGEGLVGSERFELIPLIEEELILSLPISPRHEGCDPQPGFGRGGLHHDGASGEPEENPFAALQKLRRPS
jgi:uncharacterized protein